MQISKQGLTFIKDQEGCFLFLYDDMVAPTREWKGGPLKGTLTCMIGHTAAAKAKVDMRKGTRYTEDQAMDTLATDLDEVEDAVNLYVKVKMTQGQFDALVSFGYNCGVGNLRKLIIPMNNGDYDGTRAKFSMYTRSKGVQMKGLISRRAGEVVLWDSKEVQAPETIQPNKVDTPDAPAASWMDHIMEKGAIVLGPLATATLDWKVAAILTTASMVGLGGYLWYSRKYS